MRQMIFTEYRSFSRHERLFILFAMLCSFLITTEASIVKAVSNSLFLGSYNVNSLPYAWFAVIPLNLLIVGLYNRFLPKIGCFNMLFYTTLITIFINVLSTFYLADIYALPFILYVWKDIYIMLMFQQLWSVLHATIATPRAKYLYGMIYGVGGMGSLLGSMVPGFFAVRFGSENLLLVTVPFFLLLIIVYHRMLSARSHTKEIASLAFEQKTASFGVAFKKIKNSKPLLFIMLSVIFMQLASTLLDFKFNSEIAVLFPVKDVRTEYIGRFFGVVNAVSTFLQFAGTFIFIQILGVKKTHFLIPFFLGSCVFGSIFFPAFTLLSFAYASIKSLDYSVFGVVKEMLYIPLKTEDKFQAKAVIDVFIYRTAKAFASVVIMFFQWASTLELLQQNISLTLVGIFFSWCLSVLLML